MGFIFDIARTYGFKGIHITPLLYESFGLNVDCIPLEISEFHLSYRLGGLYNILTADDCSKFETLLDNSFAIVERHKMKDISLHPPVISGFTSEKKTKSGDLFFNILRKWSAYAKENHFTLSLETHLYESYFLFGTLPQYKEFYNVQEDMGILIDISHNYFSGYGEQEILDTFKDDRVTALHISDSIRMKDEDLKLGTHLAIGDGTINFQKILSHYNINDIFAVLEIKSTNAKLKDSLDRLRAGDLMNTRLTLGEEHKDSRNKEGDSALFGLLLRTRVLFFVCHSLSSFFVALKKAKPERFGSRIFLSLLPQPPRKNAACCLQWRRFCVG